MNLRDFGVRLDGVTDDGAGIVAAIRAAEAAGRELVWPAGIARVTAPITENVSVLNWRAEGCVLNLDFSTDQRRGVEITLAPGVSHQVTGSGLTVNANGKAHRALSFRQPTGDLEGTSLLLQRVHATRAEQQVGVGEGSSNIQVSGGFELVRLEDCSSEDIMMRTGSGMIGFRGVSGIVVLNTYNLEGSYPLRTELIRCTARRTYSQDTAYTSDMDGIGVFAHPGSDKSKGLSSLYVEDSICQGNWGRDIKTQVGWTVVRDHTSIRDEGSTGGILHPAVDIQTGSGQVWGGDFHLDGNHASYGGVRFMCDPSAAPMNSRWDGGVIRLVNGASADYIFASDPNTVGRASLAHAQGQVVHGPIGGFALIRTNGADLDTIRLENVTVDQITGALVTALSKGGGSPPYWALALLERCRNLGDPAPMGLQNVTPVNARLRMRSNGCTGFT